MLKLNKKTEYAIMAIVYMSSKDRDDLSSVREIAEKFSIPKELLSKVMHVLAKNHIIKSVQGVHGGFQLEKPLEEITIMEVIHATHKPIEIVACVEGDECKCQQQEECNIKNSMLALQSGLNNLFSSMTLKDLKDNQFHQFNQFK